MKPVTIVFLHYFGGSKESWNFVIPFLEKNYHCVALNLPGFGGSLLDQKPTLKSMANYVIGEIRSLAINDCVLIGHSMGGKVAVEVAVQAAVEAAVKVKIAVQSEVQDALQISGNDLLSQLILVAPSPPSVEDMPNEQRRVLRELQDDEQVVKNVDDAIVKDLNPIAYELALKTQGEIELSARRWWVDEGISETIGSDSKQLDLPITVIASKTDPAITYEMTIKETMPN
ncbi:MAG: alpha/beta fold hydrolase, partial [Pedobacter sp.]